MTAVEVRSADPALREAIRGWIEEGRISPPRPLLLDVSVGAVDPPRPDDPRPVFEQPEVRIYSGGADGTVTLWWTHAPATTHLAAAAGRAEMRLSPEAAGRAADRLRHFVITSLIFLLRRAGWHHVHGATAVDPRGRGWLLAGNSHAGKSTTAALLAARGWAIGTDDIAFLGDSPAGRVAVHAFRSRLALRPGGEELLARTGGLPLPGRGKIGFWPEELGGGWVPVIEPDVLLFTQVGDGATAVRPVRPGEVLAQLVRWSAWVALEPALAQEHLDLLARLGAQARAFRVNLGRDLFDDPTLLERLIP